MDSMFFMKRPYDFIAMAQQERRANMVESLRKDLLSHKVRRRSGSLPVYSVSAASVGSSPSSQV